MDKNLADFFSGATNVISGNITIIRESIPDGSQFWTIKRDDVEIISFWHNPKNKPAKEKPPPKHTGGKKPYIMLMVGEVEKLRAQGVCGVEELIGYLACLGQYIEFNTGKLIHKRSKKPLQYKDLQRIFPCGNKKLNRILRELKEHDLLFNTQEGYFISSRLIKKGKANKKAEGD